MAKKRSTKKKTTPAPKSTVTIAMPRPLIRRIDRYLKGRDESRSAFIRRCVIGHLDDAEAFSKVMDDPKHRGAFMRALGDRDVVRAMVEAMGESVNDEQLDLYAEIFSNAGKGPKT